MTAFLLALGIPLIWFSVCRPIIHDKSRMERRAAAEQYRNFQAYAVLKYHKAIREDPQLSRLSIREVRRDFNLSAMYDQIGL